VKHLRIGPRAGLRDDASYNFGREIRGRLNESYILWSTTFDRGKQCAIAHAFAKNKNHL
jgi:hypothetical protein